MFVRFIALSLLIKDLVICSQWFHHVTTSLSQFSHVPSLLGHCWFLIDLYKTYSKHWNLTNLHPPLRLEHWKHRIWLMDHPNPLFIRRFTPRHHYYTTHSYRLPCMTTVSSPSHPPLVTIWSLPFDYWRPWTKLDMFIHELWLLHLDQCTPTVIDLILATIQASYFSSSSTLPWCLLDHHRLEISVWALEYKSISIILIPLVRDWVPRKRSQHVVRSITSSTQDKNIKHKNTRFSWFTI